MAVQPPSRSSTMPVAYVLVARKYAAPAMSETEAGARLSFNLFWDLGGAPPSSKRQCTATGENP
jgi:hypothetical protein